MKRSTISKRLSILTIALLILCCQQINVSNTDPPSRPEGLAASPGDGQVSLTWVESSGSESYTVYYKAGTTVTKTTGTKNTGITNLSAIVGSLTNGTTYAFCVTATNSNGESAASSVKTATPAPPPVAPAAPQKPSAVVSSGAVTLSWAKVTGADSYVVHWATGTSASTFDPAHPAVTTTNDTISGLQNGTTYAFIVVAVNTAGTSEASPVETATPALSTSAPAAPAKPSAVADGTSVAVSWSAVTGADSYIVHWKAGDSATAADPGRPAITGLSDTVPSLAAGTTYAFVVVASNGSGSSPASPVATAITAPAAPAKPSAVAGAGSVALSWTTVQGADSYKVYFAEGSVATTSDTPRDAVGGLADTVTGLDGGTKYAFIVVAINSGGASPASPVATATPTAAIPPPAAPVLDSLSREVGQTTVSWSAVTGATSYTLYYKQGTSVSKAAFDQIFTDIPSSTRSYAVTPLTNGQSYAFIVTATSAGGESVASNALTVRPGIPGVPTGVTASALGPTSAQVAWTAPTGPIVVTGYEVFRSSTQNDPSPTQLASGIASPFSDESGLAMGNTYYYKVKASSASGESDFSDESSATTPTGSPPLAPTSPTIDSIGDGSVTLSWTTAGSGYAATSFTIYWKAGSTVTKASADGSTTSAASPKQVTALANGQQYAFIVAGVNEYGEGAASTSVTGTPIAPPGAPSATSASAHPSQKKITISYGLPSSGGTPDSYNIYRSTTSGGEGTTPYAAGLAVGSYVDTGSLVAGTTYYYMVAGVNAAGVGDMSGELSATGAVPPAPTLSSDGLSVAYDSTGTVYVGGWDYTKYAMYNFVIASANALGSSCIRDGTVTVWNHYATLTWGSDGPLGPYALSQTISWIATTYNDWGTSANSNTLSVSCPANLPAPGSLSITNPSSHEIKATFGAVSGATSYILFRGPSYSGPWTAVTSGPSSPLDQTGLAAGTFYYALVGYKASPTPVTAGTLNVTPSAIINN
jgi:hypothetical protein